MLLAGEWFPSLGASVQFHLFVDVCGNGQLKDVDRKRVYKHCICE